MARKAERTTRQRNIWVDSQVKAGKPIAEVAKEAKLTPAKVETIIEGIQQGRLGPGRPGKQESSDSWEAELGGKFREERNKAGITMAELISKTTARGINADLISRFERGEKQPSMIQLSDMCRALGIKITAIWPKERHRNQQTEMQRAGHLRPSEVVDLSALLGKNIRRRNERK